MLMEIVVVMVCGDYGDDGDHALKVMDTMMKNVVGVLIVMVMEILVMMKTG